MNKYFMDVAFEEAEKAFFDNEVPVGAVIVKNDEIISKSHNLKESMNCVLKHAELNAIEEASFKFDNWRLEDCDIYITLEPCPMCASAIKQARISRVFCALSNTDVKNGEIIKNIFENSDSTNNKVEFYNNLDIDRAKEILKNFFELQRKK